MESLIESYVNVIEKFDDVCRDYDLTSKAITKEALEWLEKNDKEFQKIVKSDKEYRGGTYSMSLCTESVLSIPMSTRASDGTWLHYKDFYVPVQCLE